MTFLARRERLALIGLLVSGSTMDAQQQPNVATALPMYRPPALALVRPGDGGSVPPDRPVVVFRFAPGEPNDPVDVGTFVVTVDGDNRTRLFQVTASEAWGPLAVREQSGTPAIAAGAHQVIARICSSRGACTEAAVTVTVAPSAIATSEDVTRKRALVDVLVDIARKLLQP